MLQDPKAWHLAEFRWLNYSALIAAVTVEDPSHDFRATFIVGPDGALLITAGSGAYVPDGAEEAAIAALCTISVDAALRQPVR